MLDSCFEGTAHFAPAGETITVVNDGALPHTFTAVDGSFDTGQLEAGESYEITVEEAGIIEVFCSLHGTADGAGMAGVLVVGEAEPVSVSAPANLAVVKEAVAETSQPLADALDDQAQLIAALTNAQATLTDAVEAGGAPTGEGNVAGGSRTPGSASSWTPIASGAAGGIALSALAVAVAIRRRRDVEAIPDGLQSPLEA